MNSKSTMWTPESSTGEGQAGAQTVHRALDLLEFIAAAGEPIGISEVARSLGLTRPTAHRLAKALTQRGYLTLNEDQQYVLGGRVFNLSAHVVSDVRLLDVTRPGLQRLNEVTGETVHVAIRDRFEVVYIGKVDSRRTVRMHSTIGGRGSLHSTALGKAIWAWLPIDERDALLTGMPLLRRTETTVTDPGELRAELAKIRDRGWAVDNVENEEGIRCAGAPVLDATGYPVAAISVSGPSFRVTEELIEEFGPVLVEEALRASRAHGFRADETIND